MNSKDIKTLRSQIRQIVNEMLPQVMESILFQTLEKRLLDTLTARLDVIDNRQKDVQSYIIRQSSMIQLPKTDNKE